MKNIKNIDFTESACRNIQLGLRPDWIHRLCFHFQVTPMDFVACAEKVAKYQGDNRLRMSGFIDAPTRLSLIRDFPELAIQIIGPNTHPRRLIDTSQTESAQYDRITEYLLSMHHLVLSDTDCIQIVGIRGLESKRDGWYQTDSADRFQHQPYGRRDHFTAAKDNYDDTLICLIWKENNVPHVQYFCGISSPNAIWPNGTAHLCPGQYYYKLGRHRTRERDHIRAVLDTQILWPNDWIYDVTPDSVQYIALESASPIEVIRSHDRSLDLSPEDIETAERAIASRQPDYTNENLIKINIHTCAHNHASSLGCQNIKPTDYYDFIQTLLRITNIQKQYFGFAPDIPYSLIDASFLND